MQNTDQAQQQQYTLAKHARINKLKQLREQDPDYPKEHKFLVGKETMRLEKLNHATTRRSVNDDGRVKKKTKLTNKK